ncbi:calpastatin [Flavobacterium psychrophilum]|nr:calpastatin [Flavobacterium psychrophilum]AOE53766.1 calpastatin [Flavobacterium psychrophilum]
MDLDRFVLAQQEIYPHALKEIQQGSKHTHWMWFIFPQLKGLGSSSMAEHYGIKDKQEAIAYLKDPLLGQRLIQIANALLEVKGKSATQIFGSPDDLKLMSSMTLFAALTNTDPVFEKVLAKYFGGVPDKKTLRILENSNRNL